MSTAALSTTLVIPHYDASPLEVQAEYTFHPREREIDLHSVWIEVDGVEISVIHRLTCDQVATLVDECREDYYARMESVVEERRRNKEYDA